MLTKIKEYFASIFGILVFVLGLIWIARNLRSKYEEISYKITSANNSKALNKLQKEIDSLLTQKDLVQEERDLVTDLQKQLEEKRSNLISSEATKSTQEVENFWNRR